MSAHQEPRVVRCVAHSHRVLCAAREFGWLPGARYTNLRDVRRVDRLGFLDIDWRNYNFRKHLLAAQATRPLLTVARDILNIRSVRAILDEAEALARWAENVIIVPKTPALEGVLNDGLIPSHFLLGYSVPTRYGATKVAPSAFQRPVHLLGGRPDVQRRLAALMPVASLDCNRFTLDAAFGDYFDGEAFRPHPRGGYDTCIRASIRNIDRLWTRYVPATLPSAARSRRGA